MINRSLCLAACLLVPLAGRAVAQADLPSKAVDLSGAAQVLPNDLASACRRSGLTELRLDNAAVDPRAWPYLAAARDLETLTLAGARIPSVEPVLEAARGLPKLRRLDISRLTPSPKGVENLAAMPALEDLAISGVGEETAEALSRIKGLKSLTMLSSRPGLRGWSSIGQLPLASLSARDCGIGEEHVRFIAGISSLRSLDLEGHSLEENDYKKLAALKQLKSLNLSGSRNYEGRPYGGVNGVAMKEIASNCRDIEHLTLRYTWIRDVSSLKSLTKLRYLDLIGLQGPLDVAGLEAMSAGTKDLETLYLLNTPTDNDSSLLRAMRSFPRLKNLVIGTAWGGWGTGVSLSSLEEYPALEELVIGGLSPANFVGVTGSIVTFPQVPRLRMLNLQSCEISPNGLNTITSLNALTHLIVRRCKFDPERGFSSIAKNTSLKSIDLAATDLKGLPLTGLQNLQRLASIDLSDTGLSGESLETLKPIGSLRGLAMNRCKVVDNDLKSLQGFPPLIRLCLADTAITDRGLEYISGLASLEMLDLSKTQITDQAVKPLAGLGKLRRLNIDGTRITEAGRASLVELLSSCKFGPLGD